MLLLPRRTVPSILVAFCLFKLFPLKQDTMTHWVAGHLTGGLGNRLFQHAAAMGLAEKWSHPLVFSLPNCAPTNHGPFDNIFRLFPSVPILTEENPYINLYEPNGNVFVYTPFQSDPVAANVVVDGWRQTDKYFPARGVHAQIEDAIPLERRCELLQKYGLVGTCDQTCFLHVRLGDYKILPHHQIDIGGYLQKAMAHFPPQTRFLIFSDEATAYKKTLESFVNTTGHTALVVEETDELENLYLMSQCWKGAIVANSTFSWWGAYFARQRSPNPSSFLACYPKVWGQGLPAARDIVPSWGITVDNQ